MLKSALSFYKKLLTALVTKVFTVNPDGPRMVTMTIRKVQMTICWHMYDLKVSYHRRAEATKIEHWLRSIYGNISDSRGKKHIPGNGY